MNAIVEAITKAAPVVKPPEPFTKAIPPTPWPADALPAGMDEAARAIAEHVQAPEALAAFSVIGAVVHLAQRLVDARHPAARDMPSSLDLLASGDSGDRKSTCYNAAMRPIIKREAERRQEYRRKFEEMADDDESLTKRAIVKKLGPDPRTIFTDTTVQKIAQVFIDGSQPALSLSTDEGGTLFSGHSMKAATRAANMGTLTRLFDGRGVERDRIGINGMDPSGFRYNVRLSLFLSAQPIVLEEALNDPVMRGQGLLPRFLYGAPASIAGSRFQDRERLSRQLGDNPDVVRYWETLECMDSAAVIVDEHGGLDLPTAEIEGEAVQTWIDLYNDTEREQGPLGEYADLRPFAARAGELCARLAAVYAVWRKFHTGSTTDVTVTADDMWRASRVVHYSLAEWRRHDETGHLSPVECDAKDLLEWLQGKKQEKGWQRFTRSTVAQSGPYALRHDKKRRNAAIEELERRFWLLRQGTDLVLQASNPETATAISAISATRRPVPVAVSTSESSKSSGSSSSNRPDIPARPETIVEGEL